MNRSRAVPIGPGVRRLAGMTPRQNSSGGKERLGVPANAATNTIRSLLIAGAVAILRHALNCATKDAASVPALLERKPTKVARRMSVSGGAQATANAPNAPSRRLAHHADRDQPRGEIQSGQPREEGRVLSDALGRPGAVIGERSSRLHILRLTMEGPHSLVRFERRVWLGRGFRPTRVTPRRRDLGTGRRWDRRHARRTRRHGKRRLCSKRKPDSDLWRGTDPVSR